MKLKINIDGKEYEADIEVLEEERRDPILPQGSRASGKQTEGAAPAATSAAAEPVATSSASDEKTCKSSIVGIVVMVQAKPGQDVKAGEPLVVLEAMKMESNVLSPIDGRVKAILVGPGDSVKKGQALVEFE
jgi:biotin carboxyl carrier protein